MEDQEHRPYSSCPPPVFQSEQTEGKEALPFLFDFEEPVETIDGRVRSEKWGCEIDTLINNSSDTI